MILFMHEWRTGKRNFLLWTISIAFFLSLCVFMFPEMEGQMKDVTKIFSAMGSFTSAFGLDRLNMGTLTGFYAVECGNILSVGGAFFAAMIGISALSKEEETHTAEFLLTHPISRMHIMSGKFWAILTQLLALNIVCLMTSAISMLAIGQEIPWSELFLLHLAYFLVQLEIAMICFGLSAFLKNGGFGLGIGLAAVLYFMNIIANISEKARILKILSPFGFAEGADLVGDGHLNLQLVFTGMVIGILFMIVGSIYYNRKDIR